MTPQPTPRGTDMANLSERLNRAEIVEAMVRNVLLARYGAEALHLFFSPPEDLSDENRLVIGDKLLAVRGDVRAALAVVSPILDRLTVEGLAGVMRELVREQSEGEWDDAMINADADKFTRRLLTYITEETHD